MAVNWSTPDPQSLWPVAGVRLGSTEAGIRKASRLDLMVMTIEPGAAVGGVFTRNRYCAAPVQVCREHLTTGADIRALVVNTGYANAGTGDQGLLDARAVCAALAQQLGVTAQQILPFSTGVIMEPLPVQRIIDGLPAALADRGESGAHWLRAAQAIMTTDTVAKAASRRVTIGGVPIAVTGIAKGAGMIRPNMATMLGFVATDAVVDRALMPTLVQRVADASFNRITVDGDTSTNDSFIVIATGRATNPPITSLESPEGRDLLAAITDVARTLAHAIVRDGEGATKFITVRVEGGRNTDECLRVAYAIAYSPLVKTAFFASDPNLGRILAAIGYAGIDDLDQQCIELYLDDVHVVTRGGRHPDYRDEDGARVMQQAEITVRVHLGRGDAAETVWTCDLSHDYVRINADYRS